VVPAGLQPLAGGGPALLRPVAEGEQGLFATLRRSGAGDLEHLFALEERGGQPVRDGGERAVVASVAAQARQRDEHLAGVGDDTGAALGHEPRVADARGGVEELVQVRAAGSEQDGGLGDVEDGPVACPAQRPPDRGVGGWGELGGGEG
jgi:hypothetical protein